MDSTPSKASFSNANRHMQEEEELRLTSVGVDIGSSTTHLVFSRLELHLEGTRYRVTNREVLKESEILLTPYVDETRIDVEALARDLGLAEPAVGRAAVDGRLDWREFEAKDGSKRQAVEIIADSVQFLGSRGDGEGGGGQSYIPQSDVAADQSDFVKAGATADDDIPF